MPNLKVVVQYDDVKLNSTAKIQTTILNVDNIISATTNPPTFYRNAVDSLMPIKGNTTFSQSAIIGYYTSGNTSMAQSVPTNKFDLPNAAPRVMFIVA